MCSLSISVNFFIFHHLISILPTPMTVSWRMSYSHCVCASKIHIRRDASVFPGWFYIELQIQEIYGLTIRTQYIFQKANLSSKAVLGVQRETKIIWQLHYILLIFSLTFLYSTPPNNFSSQVYKKAFGKHKTTSQLYA